MLTNFNPIFLDHLKDIDVKSFDYPWLEEAWDDLDRYIVRTWLEDGTPRGYSVMRFLLPVEAGIFISKIAVHPKYRCKGIGTVLLRDIEDIANRHKIDTLTVTLHEENDLGINWLMKRDFKGSEVLKSRPGLFIFPDGRDGYNFKKEL